MNMHSKLMSIMLVFNLLISTAMAGDTWYGLSWGMAVDQVKRAQPDAVEVDDAVWLPSQATDEHEFLAKALFNIRGRLEAIVVTLSPATRTTDLPTLVDQLSDLYTSVTGNSEVKRIIVEGNRRTVWLIWYTKETQITMGYDEYNGTPDVMSLIVMYTRTKNGERTVKSSTTGVQHLKKSNEMRRH